MTNRRVLIIDSQEQDLQKLKRILEDAGYRAAVALNGEEGVRLAQELFPEVVILAIQSPHLNGLQILQRLKKRGTTRDLPVLIILDKFDEEYAAQGLQMGAADYLLRSAKKELFYADINQILKLSQRRSNIPIFLQW